jgi:hypothetical protein
MPAPISRISLPGIGGLWSSSQTPLSLTKWFSRPFFAILVLKTKYAEILPTPTGAWAGPHPSNIEMRHVDRIRSEKVLTANDVYGQGELFFGRKVRDPEVVDQLEQFLQTQPDIERVTIEQ